MANTFFKHRWQKITLIAVGIVIILLRAAVLSLNSILEPKLSKKLKEAVLKGTDSLYTISYSDLDLNVLQGKVIIKDVEIKADTSVYQKLKREKKAPNNLYQLQLKQLAVAEIHVWELYSQKKLNIGRITSSHLKYHQTNMPNRTVRWLTRTRPFTKK